MTQDHAQIFIFFHNETQRRWRFTVLKKHFKYSSPVPHTVLQHGRCWSWVYKLYLIQIQGIALKPQKQSTTLLCQMKTWAWAHTLAHSVSIIIIPCCLPQESPTWMFNYRSLRRPSGIQQSISILLQTAFKVISLNQHYWVFRLRAEGENWKEDILRELFCLILSRFPGKITSLF